MSPYKATDRHLVAAVPIAHCAGRPISALPAGLLRNSLDGLVHCHQSNVTGKFLAFRNRQLLDVYASKKGYALDQRFGGSIGTDCAHTAGVAERTWFDQFDSSYPIGKLTCYGAGREATVEWTDSGSSTLAKVRGQSRGSVYRWWRRHAFGISRHLGAIKQRAK